MARERCELAGRGECDGPVQWHHAIKQQRIRRRFRWGARLDLRTGAWEPAGRLEPVRRREKYALPLSAILSDERNRMWLCSGPRGHHDRLERDYSDLPASVWEFAREFGLDAELENDIARQRG